MTYEFDWKVRAADTDFSGRIYTPAVLDYTVRAINQLMEDIDHSAYQLSDRMGVIYPVVRAEVEYLEAVATGDLVTIHLEPDVGGTSITFEATGYRAANPVFEATVTVVFADKDSGESRPVPDEVRERLPAVAGD